MATMTTTQALGHLEDMQNTLGQLAGALEHLTSAGNAVAQSWQGASAEAFHTTWVAYQSNFDQLRKDMNTLHGDVQNINNNIANAGGGFG